jgi:hypothetical protein
MLAPFALLATGAFLFADAGGVKTACLENARGKTGRARIEIVVGSGALAETESERGVAHLLEHVLMRPLGFDHENAETTLDSTMFYRDVRSTDLSTSAVDLVKAVSKIAIGRDEFAIEREVVLRELEGRGLSLGASDPLFGGTILSRPVGGTPESVRELSLEDATRFHARNYVKKNIAVLIRGAPSCDTVRSAISSALDEIPDGEAQPVPKVETPEPGVRSLGQAFGLGDFMRGFYWYRSTVDDEVVMMLAAKHLEQRALNELRKEQGITYSPQARFQRLAGGGRIFLTVQTSGQGSLVDRWYDKTVDELRSSDKPMTVLKNALGPVTESLEGDGLRAALAAIRGERLPEEALAGLNDAALHERIHILLAGGRAFGSATPTRNVASLVILGVFGVLVLVAIGFATRRMLFS